MGRGRLSGGRGATGFTLEAQRTVTLGGALLGFPRKSGHAAQAGDRAWEAASRLRPLPGLPRPPGRPLPRSVPLPPFAPHSASAGQHTRGGLGRFSQPPARATCPNHRPGRALRPRRVDPDSWPRPWAPLDRPAGTAWSAESAPALVAAPPPAVLNPGRWWEPRRATLPAHPPRPAPPPRTFLSGPQGWAGSRAPAPSGLPPCPDPRAAAGRVFPAAAASSPAGGLTGPRPPPPLRWKWGGRVGQPPAELSAGLAAGLPLAPGARPLPTPLGRPPRLPRRPPRRLRRSSFLPASASPRHEPRPRAARARRKAPPAPFPDPAGGAPAAHPSAPWERRAFPRSIPRSLG